MITKAATVLFCKIKGNKTKGLLEILEEEENTILY